VLEADKILELLNIKEEKEGESKKDNLVTEEDPRQSE
jgi:hypothetical protein